MGRFPGQCFVSFIVELKRVFSRLFVIGMSVIVGIRIVPSGMQYGSVEESRAAAVEYRDAVFSDMQAHRNDLAEFMDHELEHVQQLLREKGSSAISHHRGR